MRLLPIFILLFFVGCKKNNQVDPVRPIEKITITGTVVDCNNNKVTNGKIFINYVAEGSYYRQLLDGKFSTTISNNDPTTPIYIVAIDNVTQKQSALVKISRTSEKIDIGTIKACDAIATEFINLQVDGLPFSWTSIRSTDSVFASCRPISSNIPWKTEITIFGRHLNTAPTTESFAKIYLYHNNSTGSVYLSGMQFENPQFNPSINMGYIRDSGIANLTEMGERYEGFISGNISNAKLYFQGGVIRTANGTFRVRRIHEYE